RERGLTLAEILICIVLLVLVLVLSFNFLVPALRIATLGLLRVGMEEEAMIALNRLTGDLQMTTPNGVTISYTSPCLVATNWFVVNPSGQVVDNTGLVQWEQQFHISYLDPTSGEFRHRIWPCNPPGSSDPALPPALATGVNPKKISPASVLLPAIVGDRSVCTILAHDVSQFVIEPSGANLQLVQPLKFTILIERSGNTGSTKPQSLSYSRSVFMAGSQ
ncbi:unnamed protein product, partial [Phaeothamnion confervicola]